jgi:hypothetical protein
MGNEMKLATTEEIPVGVIHVQETIKVTRNAPRMMYGSCNACTNREGNTVTNIDLRGMSFRLCDGCRKSLKKAL